MSCSKGSVPAPSRGHRLFRIGIVELGRLPICLQILMYSLAACSMNWDGFGPTFLRATAGSL
jgi:hypothetical protein